MDISNFFVFSVTLTKLPHSLVHAGIYTEVYTLKKAHINSAEVVLITVKNYLLSYVIPKIDKTAIFMYTNHIETFFITWHMLFWLSNIKFLHLSDGKIMIN